MSGYNIKTVDEMASLHHGLVRLAGAELGVESFGIQILDLPPDFSEYPEHDHEEDGQEEVYAVVRGRCDFIIDGETLPAGEGQIVRVAPESRRKLTTGRDGARILAVGASRTRQYERPEDFRLAVGA